MPPRYGSTPPMPIAKKTRGRPPQQTAPATPSPVQPPQIEGEPSWPDETLAAPVVAPAAVPEVIGPTAVMLGSVEGVLRYFPVDTLLGVLAETFGSRLETLRSSASVLAQVDEVRDTEGRCAPIIFSGDADTAASLLAGLEGLAAAMVSGIPNYAVILISPADVGTMQAWLVGCRQKDEKTPFRSIVGPVFSVSE